MKTKISIYDFRFKLAGYGQYDVTYLSPVTGKKWTAHVSCMPLIDKTKNADEQKRCDLESLKYFCKNN